MHKQALVKRGKVQTYIDLSALYPKDPMRQPQEHANARQTDPDCTDGNHCEKKKSEHCGDGDHCEHGAMREALEGWRWI